MEQLTLRQKILSILQESPGISTTEIGKRMGKSQSCISGVVSVMRQKGELVRKDRKYWITDGPNTPSTEKVSYEEVSDFVKRIPRSLLRATLNLVIDRIDQ